MWFGNTTIMLMAAVMGISMDIFEASELDGCNSIKRFFYITLPLIRPILAYTLITSIIGGLQMFVCFLRFLQMDREIRTVHL